MKTEANHKTGQVHHGENIRKVRTLLNVKQEVFARKLGPTWSQTRISKLEHRERIDARTIYLVADVLGVPPDIIEKSTQEFFELALQVVRLLVTENASTVSLTFERLITLSPLADAINNQIRLTNLLLKGQQDNQKLLSTILQRGAAGYESQTRKVTDNPSPPGKAVGKHPVALR